MNEQLERALKSALDLAEKTGQFAIEQAPELLQQFYRWHLALNVFIVLIGFFLFFVCFYLYKKREDFFDDEMVEVMSIIGMLFSLVPFAVGTVTIVKIIVAPKIYLIEYFL